jgi:hypothetical protein
VTAMKIETILVRARALVAQGLLHDRECSSAETIHKKLVQYTDPRAARFSPAAAVFRAEHDLRSESKRAWKPLDTEALRLLSKHGSMSAFYRKAKTLDEVLACFDKAIERLRSEEKRNQRYHKHEREEVLEED